MPKRYVQMQAQNGELRLYHVCCMEVSMLSVLPQYHLASKVPGIGTE